MNKLVLIAAGSSAVFACLALLMGVLPGIALSKTPPGPGVVPLTALQVTVTNPVAGSPGFRNAGLISNL